ncbi:MAG: hypothetical protein ACT4R6_10560 [Gemmatimonadaceae bacterium]
MSAERQTTDSAAASAEIQSGVNTIALTARDFSFQAPDTVPAGPTRFQMTNAGQEPHHVIVVHLDSGKTVGEFLRETKGEVPPPWAHMMGGPIAPLPGGPATATTVNLVPGKYALICVIPTADGMPHVAKGMVRELTVTQTDRDPDLDPDPAAAAVPITATTTLTLADYSFALSTPLTAGKQVIRVVNTASQPHEVVIVRLAAGKTVGDVAAWAEKPAGPPPADVVGGASFVMGTVENFIDVELTPGEYGLLCFVPDAKDGKPHVVHGMLSQITVN